MKRTIIIICRVVFSSYSTILMMVMYRDVSLWIHLSYEYFHSDLFLPANVSDFLISTEFFFFFQLFSYDLTRREVRTTITQPQVEGNSLAFHLSISFLWNLLVMPFLTPRIFAGSISKAFVNRIFLSPLDSNERKWTGFVNK